MIITENITPSVLGVILLNIFQNYVKEAEEVGKVLDGNCTKHVSYYVLKAVGFQWETIANTEHEYHNERVCKFDYGDVSVFIKFEENIPSHSSDKASFIDISVAKVKQKIVYVYE